MKHTENQHVQVPNNMTKNKTLTPECLLVYAYIKKYMNRDTLEAYPSLTTICSELGASEPTIRKCIKLLVELEYISVRKEGRKNVYKFSEYKKFEPFSYEFLENKECTFTEKAMILAEQQYMFKDKSTHEGKMNYSNRQMSELINMSHVTISRCTKSLQEKGLMRVVQTNTIDPATGCKIQEKIYDLDRLHQGIVFAICNHEERIQQTERDVEDLRKQLQSLQKDYILTKQENERLLQKLTKTEEIIL